MHRIPCTIMRSGTSKGPYFLASDLPSWTDDRDQLDAVLLHVMGSPHPRQIDGLGGGTSVTSKVAIVAPSTIDGVDVDYLFAQVAIDEPVVDWSPTCGNMLTAVGGFAIERGIVQPQHGETAISVRAVNTGAMADLLIQTPNGEVAYEGDTVIAGVPGTAAPVDVTFRGLRSESASTTFPLGETTRLQSGLDVSCVNAVMPCVMARASDFGVTGYESPAELGAVPGLVDRIQAARIEAGELMGFADVANSVVPKFVLLAPPAGPQGHLTARYFTPMTCHPSMAVSGGICISIAAVRPGTISHELSTIGDTPPETVVVNHPSGALDVRLGLVDGPETAVDSATIVRTVRPLIYGEVTVPASLSP